MKKNITLLAGLLLFFNSLCCLSQDYYWSSTANPSFFSESNWSLTTSNGNIPSNSINTNTAINKDLLISKAPTIIGKVWGKIKMGSGTLTVDKSQIVMNTGSDYGIDMGTGKDLTLNDARIHTDYISNAAVTLKSNSQLYIYNATNALENTTINIKSRLSRVFFVNLKPSEVESTYLHKISIWGSTAVNGSNAYLKQYYNGTMMQISGQDNSAMTAYAWVNYNGAVVDVKPFERLTNSNVPTGNNNISSFVLRKGYVAVLAENSNGTGNRKTFIAAKDDLFVPNLGVYNLNNSVSLLRIMPWDQVNKKGNAAWVEDELNNALNLDWFYNWSDWKTATNDSEYVPMVWGGDLVATGQTQTLINNYKDREDINTVLAFNEPDPCYMQSGQYYNMCDVDTAVSYYKELLSLGLRIGAPAVTGSPDGFAWLDSFMTKANAQNLHVDFIPVHYYGQVNAATFMSYWETIYNKWGLPIWVTEFNYGGSWETKPSTAVHNQNIIEWVEAMDNTDYIERYAFFSFSPNEYHGLWSSIDNGVLNDLGKWYRDHEAPEAFVDFKDNKDCNGVTNGFAFIDNCGICVSGNTKKIIEDSCQGLLQSKTSDTKSAIELDNISTYPNPVADLLQIEGIAKNTNVNIYAISGKLLFSAPVYTGKNQINLSLLSSGIYVLEFEDGKHINIIKK